MKSLLIKKNEAGQRLDKYLKKLLPEAPSSFLYKMLRKKNIVLNGRKADGSEMTAVGDEVRLWLSEETFGKFSASPSRIYRDMLDPDRIIFQNEDILIYNKPAGTLSQQSREGDVSVNEQFVSYMLREGQITEEELNTFHPGICNRLDRNTSGIIVCGKSLRGLQTMGEALRNRTAHKDYLAAVTGRLDIGRDVRNYLIKDPDTNRVSVYDEEKKGSEMIHTAFRTVYCDDSCSLIMCRIYTGKSHQIRAQLAHLGHPVIGDRKYAGTVSGNGKRGKGTVSAGSEGNGMCLHSYRLSLDEKTVFTAEVPDYFRNAVKGYQWEHGRPGAFEDLPLRS